VRKFGELGSLAATTDLVSNATNFPRIDLQTDAGWLFRLGPSPEQHLPSFLHEATHHWCFQSPVVSALVTVLFEAQRQVAGIIMLEDDQERLNCLRSAQDRLARFEATLAVLRPLSEGLACFAEFDATPRFKTRVRSEPMNWAAMGFGMPLPGEPWEDTTMIIFGDKPPEGADPSTVEVDQWLMRLVGRMRVGQPLLDRKANLLIQPFDIAHGGYLPGYLSVKTLWHVLSLQVPRFRNETDLLLVFLRNFFFDDPGLVSVLLDPVVTEAGNAAEACLSRVFERVRQLDELTSDHVDALEDAIDSVDPRGPRYWGALLIPEGVQAQGTQRQDETIHWWSEVDEADGEIDKLFKHAWRANISTRNQILLGSSQGSVIASKEDVTVSCGHGPIDLTDAAVLVEREGKFDAADIAVFFCKGHNGFPYRGLSVFDDQELVALALLPGLEAEDELQMVHSNLVAHPLGHVFGGFIRNDLRNFMDVNEKTLRDEGVRSSIANRAEWLCVALTQMAEANNAETDSVELLREEGFYPLFGSMDEVDAFAALTLAAMTNPFLDFVDKALHDHGLDGPAARAKLAAVSSRCGLPVCATIEDCLLVIA
jgi:hypothetical protein